MFSHQLYTQFSHFPFTGKERDAETGYNYFGARYYDSDLSGLFLSVDPMSDKYPSVSPYVYCAWNPIKLIDPDGRRVKPFGNRALTAIKNTLPLDARNYVTLNEEGYIDLDRLEQYSGDCYNYNCLKELVSSEEYNIEIHLSNSFSYKDRNGQFVEKDESSIMYYFPADDPYASTTGLYNLSTGETGFYGKTLFPDGEGLQNSPNGNIVIHLNERLSDKGIAETYSHEANGHALLYVRSNGDRQRASHDYQGSTDANTELKEMIKSSTRETVQYNQEP